MSRGRLRQWVGLAALTLGALLLAVVGVYFAYVAQARHRLGDISVQGPLVLPPSLLAQGPALTSGDVVSVAPPQAQDPIPPSAAPGQQPGQVAAGDTGKDSPPSSSAPPRAPALSAGPFLDEPAEEEIAQPTGFRPLRSGERLPRRSAPPTRLRIPALGLDAEVKGLRIRDLGDAREYETPVRVVGHIPETANPGGRGNVWLFGHLESPIRGEGSIFQDLPQVYDLLRRGQQVYVIVDSAEGSFLYQVRSFRKMPQEELYLWEADGPVVSLVTCWPRYKYDERIVVTAELVGVAPPQPA